MFTFCNENLSAISRTVNLVVDDLCFWTGHHHSSNNTSTQMKSKLEYWSETSQCDFFSFFSWAIRLNWLHYTGTLYTYSFIEILHRLNGFVCMTANDAINCIWSFMNRISWEDVSGKRYGLTFAKYERSANAYFYEMLKKPELPTNTNWVGSMILLILNTQCAHT